MSNASKIAQRSTISSVVKMAANKFIGVTFTKKDGSTRRLNGRFGVHSKTAATPTTAGYKEYLTIFDVKSMGFRTINLDTISSIRTGGVELSLI